MSFLDDLNASVHTACAMPRVRFEVGLGEAAESWIRKKHADGAVHEPATIAAFLAVARHYPKTKAVFDIGASWGYFSLLSVMLFEEAEVTAFEMHPIIFKALVPNVAPSVRCEAAVVSDVADEKVRFWISGFNIYEEPPGGWDDLGSIPGAMKMRGENSRGSGFWLSDFITVDGYCARHDVAPGLIKIDVEGYQAKAIKGALETIRTHKPIVILELHDPEKLERFGTTNKDTVAPLLEAGYEGYWCGDHRSPKAVFERVEEMEARHEKLSIMVLVPT